MVLYPVVEHDAHGQGVTRVLQGCYRGVTGVLQGFSKGISKGVINVPRFRC
jgi:hypothetical protein